MRFQQNIKYADENSNSSFSFRLKCSINKSHNGFSLRAGRAPALPLTVVHSQHAQGAEEKRPFNDNYTRFYEYLSSCQPGGTSADALP